jgi:hypothetical protein
MFFLYGGTLGYNSRDNSICRESFYIQCFSSGGLIIRAVQSGRLPPYRAKALSHSSLHASARRFSVTFENPVTASKQIAAEKKKKIVLLEFRLTHQVSLSRRLF